MSKKQNSLYKAPRTIDDIEPLVPGDSIKIDMKAKKRLLGRLRSKTFKW